MLGNRNAYDVQVIEASCLVCEVTVPRPGERRYKDLLRVTHSLRSPSVSRHLMQVIPEVLAHLHIPGESYSRRHLAFLRMTLNDSASPDHRLKVSREVAQEGRLVGKG